MFTSFRRVIRSGFIGFWRNGYVSIAAIFVMGITLTVVGSGMLVGQLLNAALTQIKDKVDINVYLVTSADEAPILALKSKLEALPDVKEVTYTPREKALADFEARHQKDELTMQALEELGDNPLGASLSIRAKDTTQYESIASYLQQQQSNEDPNKPLIDRVNFNQNKDAINRLTAIMGAVERSSYIAMMILIAASILITFNTIRLAIYTTREEISIMRLVGASNMFIRGPFMVQGIMYGLIAGVATLLIMYPVVIWLGPYTETFFSLNIFNYFVNHFGYLFFVLVGSGVVIGIISSTLAVARYLRV